MNVARIHFGAGVGAEVPFSARREVSGEAEVVAEASAVDGGVGVGVLPWAAP